MTVAYANDIATVKLFSLVKLLLFRWRGSVLRLLWTHLLAFSILYLATMMIFLTILTKDTRNELQKYASYVQMYEDEIPITLMLGFFVGNVMIRWFDQYMAIPWPYSIAVLVSSNIQGYDEVGRAMRRTIMRYVCLSLTMVFRVLSPRVKERFPKMKDLIDAGLLYENELKIIEELDAKFPLYSKNFLPIVWASSLVNRARDEGRIRDNITAMTLIQELNKFRSSCGTLTVYNRVCIPLVYTQLVIIAIYSKFIVHILLDQILLVNKKENAFEYVPESSFFQFIIYMGWLKVAETMLNPFGKDDDDFEVNYMIDRNLQMSYLIVDDMHNDHPLLLKDQYWNEMPEVNDENVMKSSEPVDTFNVASGKSTEVSKKQSTDVEADQRINGSELSQSRFDLIPQASTIDKSYIERIKKQSNIFSYNKSKTNINQTFQSFENESDFDTNEEDSNLILISIL